mmetsp:Transcript_44421/g.69448  ORF Transcript_44421/g.69448 Transcript_44421/m.69448 type:complete len:98 (+) Transcript_44421:1230-1523(+)
MVPFNRSANQQTLNWQFSGGPAKALQRLCYYLGPLQGLQTVNCCCYMHQHADIDTFNTAGRSRRPLAGTCIEWILCAGLTRCLPSELHHVLLRGAIV